MSVTKYCRFQAGSTIAYGVLEGEQVRQLDGDLFGTWKRSEMTHPLKSIRLLAPIVQPSKVLATAGNYKSHLADMPVPEHPELFFKSPTCIIGPEDAIVIPAHAVDVHYEAELVIVIGKTARQVSPERALDYVLGITCGNDVSERTWQKGDRQWWRGKGTDTFGPIGPWIVSGINYGDLLLQLRLNSKVLQEQRTCDMEHGVASIVSWISKHITLEPGDLIFTGTPGTTTSMKPGDSVEVELEGVGVLRNPVVAAKG